MVLQGRSRPMRYCRGSPPYYKDLGSPPRLTASPMQKTWEARPTAGGGFAASQKPLGILSPTRLLLDLRPRQMRSLLIV